MIYRRGRGEPWHVWAAAAGGLIAGTVTFYLARIWLEREPIGPAPVPDATEDASREPEAGESATGRDR